VFVAARSALRPGGTLVFTLEASPDDTAADFVLTPSGRFAHTHAGIRARLAQAGLVERRIAAASPRDEGGKAVPGWLVVATR
jgi:predicted TPR repeat methyltransferase